VIQARGVGKRFGRRKVLEGLDIDVGPGQIVALMGPNGSGKTTLLRILAALTSPTSGRVVVAGFDVSEEPISARRRIGLVGHSTYTYDDLTALENLRFYRSMYGRPQDGFDDAGRDLLRRVGLAHRMNDRASVLSRGMRQRLAIARALIHSPKVLLLDEPFSSLDQKGVDVLSQILQEERARGCSILVVTHDIDRVSALADRADLLVRGRISQSFDRSAIMSGQLLSAYRTSSEGGIS